MVSPRSILLALAVVACVSVASYVLSTVLLRSSPTQTSSPPAAQTPSPPATRTKAEPAAPPANFHAIVERNGAVVLCVSNDEIMLPDRCAGTGRLLIVQPIAEGEVVWVSATGVVSIENEVPQNPNCAMSRAKWDPTTEQTTSTGRKIRAIPDAAVAQQLNRIYPGEANLMPEDISSFAVDLDNDGKEEIVYVANSVPRLAGLREKTQQSYRYFLQGGIFRGRSPDHPSPFVHEVDEYRGGTDATGQVAFKGIVPMDTTSGELALLARTGNGLDGNQSLVWFGGEGVQRFESFEFRCK